MFDRYDFSPVLLLELERKQNVLLAEREGERESERERERERE